MLDAGQLGSSGLPGTAPVSLVVAASFRRDRDERRYGVCADLVCHIYQEAAFSALRCAGHVRTTGIVAAGVPW